MTLIVDAETAEDIADAFSKFKAPVPDHAPDITASISELYAIGSTLREIDAALNSAEHGRNILLIEKDLDLVCSLLRHTIDDIFRILGDIGSGSRVLNDGMYRQTWKDIALFFTRNGQMTLRTRLEKYRRFMIELVDIVKRFEFCSLRIQIVCSRTPRRAPKTPLLGNIRGEIQGLVPEQDRLSKALNEMSLGANGASIL